MFRCGLFGLIIINVTYILQDSALMITLPYQQNMYVFADGCKNINDIFYNHVCSVSLIVPGLHFQNV